MTVTRHLLIPRRGQPNRWEGRVVARGKQDAESRDIHVEYPTTTPPWFAYGRFRVVNRGLELAEVRFFPGDDRAASAANEDDLPPIGVSSAWVPARMFTASALRGLPIGRMRQLAIECVEPYGEGPMLELERQRSARRSNRADARKRPGRAGRSDEYYATWALRYVERMNSRSPVKDLAMDLGLKSTQVRDKLQMARKRGLLTGGQYSNLTEKAKGLLGSRAEGLPYEQTPTTGTDGTREV